MDVLDPPCDQLNGCLRIAGHVGCHTPHPHITTLDFDLNREAVVVRLVMRAIRAGRVDALEPYLARWMKREVELGLR